VNVWESLIFYGAVTFFVGFIIYLILSSQI
jgi:hypothetical protein